MVCLVMLGYTSTTRAVKGPLLLSAWAWRVCRKRAQDLERLLRAREQHLRSKSRGSLRRLTLRSMVSLRKMSYLMRGYSRIESYEDKEATTRWVWTNKASQWRERNQGLMGPLLSESRETSYRLRMRTWRKLWTRSRISITNCLRKLKVVRT